MKLLSFNFCVGTIIGARLLLAHGKPVEISGRDVKGDLLGGMLIDVTESSIINLKSRSPFLQ
jgi:hypothetical protein